MLFTSIDKLLVRIKHVTITVTEGNPVRYPNCAIMSVPGTSGVLILRKMNLLRSMRVHIILSHVNQRIIQTLLTCDEMMRQHLWELV